MNEKYFAIMIGRCVNVVGKERSDSIKDQVINEASKRKVSINSNQVWVKRQLLMRLRKEAIFELEKIHDRSSEIANILGISEGLVRRIRAEKTAV